MANKINFNSMFEDIKKTNVIRDNNNKGGKKSFEVEGLFKNPEFKDGKFTVIMRFLPSAEGLPYVENRGHMTQLPNGMWLGCDCLKKFNKPCPICDYNQKIYGKYSKEEARDKVMKKWQPKYYSNVLIVKNPNAPETEGQIFRFEYKRAIMKIIAEAMQEKPDPETGDMVPGINPFSWFGPKDDEVLSGDEKAGANFIYEATQSAMGPNYSNSHFSAPRRISKYVNGTLEELSKSDVEELQDNLYTLKDIEHKEEEVQTYEQILAQYKKKTGTDMFAEFGETTTTQTIAQSAPKASKNTVEVDDTDIFESKATDAVDEDEIVSNDSFFDSFDDEN